MCVCVCACVCVCVCACVCALSCEPVILSQILGDWKFMREEFQMAHHYNTHALICWMCGASVVDPNCYAYDVSWNAPWVATRTTHEEILDFGARDLPVSRLRGFHSSMLMADLMHTVSLGVMLFTCAGVLWELCLGETLWRSPAHGRWQDRRNAQLQLATAQF